MTALDLDLPLCPVCKRPAHAAESDDLDRHPTCAIGRNPRSTWYRATPAGLVA